MTAPYYTITGLARIKRTSRQTVHAAIASGELPAENTACGLARLIPRASAEAWQPQRRRGPRGNRPQ